MNDFGEMEDALMKLFFWIEDDGSGVYHKSASILENIYSEMEMEYFTSNGNVKSCIAAGKALKYIAKEEVKNYDFDAILAVGKEVNRYAIIQECNALGIDDSKVIFDFEVCIPGFNMKKSNRLHRSRISIFSINNWNGKIYKKFHLPCLSPFLGSVMTTEDWLELLKSPQKYIYNGLRYAESITNIDGTKIPVFKLGESELKLFMLYEKDVEKIKREWMERVKLINWTDLLLVMYTEHPEVLNEFDRLPYGKKICFTSFESHLDSAFYLPSIKDENDEILPLWSLVDRLLETDTPYYDLWDLLLYGKRTKL